MASIIGQILNMIKGISLLRHAEIIRFLGEERFRMFALAEIRSEFPKAKIDRGVQWFGYEKTRLRLGDGAAIGYGTVLSFGDEVNGFGCIEVGSHTWIGQYNNIRACDSGNIIIGSCCLISQFCSLVGSNHSIRRNEIIRDQAPDHSRIGIVIQDDVWLGAGVSVMPGVSIGCGAVIGANSVVTKTIPAYEIWAGNPASKIGER